MRVHCSGDVSDISQVAINKFTQADVIVHCATPAAAADEELKIWNAERVLCVNQQKGDSLFQSGGRRQVVLMRPIARLICAGGVIHFPYLANAGGIKKRWDGKSIHNPSIPLRELHNAKQVSRHSGPETCFGFQYVFFYS